MGAEFRAGTGTGASEDWRLALSVSLAVGPLALDLTMDTRARRIGLVGPSGAGKSTALRVLAGLEPRARGRVTVAGVVWQDSATRVFVPPWERRVGWVPQDAALFPHASVRENLAWAGAPGDEVVSAAERLGVAGLMDRRPRNLSGGERQRVALGRAMLARPSLLLLDEPFAALDDALGARLAGVVAAFCNERRCPLVLVSHHERDLRALVDEVWTCADGRLHGPE